MAEENKGYFMLIAIVAIVAIVAVVMLVSGGVSTKGVQTVAYKAAGDSGNLGGQAVAGGVAVKSGKGSAVTTTEGCNWLTIACQDICNNPTSTLGDCNNCWNTWWASCGNGISVISTR